LFKAAINEEIKVPANIDYLGDLRNFVTKAGRKHNFPANVVNAFKLCIDEAATNIIKHAYRDWDGMITMRVIVKKNSMTVVLVDQGKYFDPSRVDDPDLKRYVEIGKKGGLGIFIMRKLLDEIDYHHTEDGNELRLTKFRDSSYRRKERAVSTSLLTLSIKTKYTFMTAAALTVLVAIVYFYFFFAHGNRMFNEIVADGKFASEEIARNVLQGANADFTTPYITPIADNYIKERKEIYRLIFTDENDYLVYTNDDDLFIKFFNSEFKPPVPNEQVRPFLIKYKDNEKEVIYSFINDIYNNDEERIKIGKVYLEIKKDYVSGRITDQRLKDFQVAVFILLVGYAGTFILVYFILNPFRKLGNWIRELGSGDVKDEIDFDSNDEVGEIAQAFTEITDKFRESQKNLAEQERIQKEMQLAQDIQQTLLPADVPELEGYEIASHYEAAKEVGGDYFDFVQVDKDTLGIVVADVSGKGVPGSLVMTMIRTALRTEARSIKSASEVLARVNEFVVNDMKKGMFVTLFYVIIDSKKRRINYASAGHNPMILYRLGTEKTYYLNPRGFPVGISLPDPELFKKSIESDTIQLTEDDILIIYTDGITEAMNNRRELFSEERLQDAVRKYGHLQAKEFINKLKDEIHSFTEGYEQNDDITVVTIKERSTQEKIELNRAQMAHQLILKGKNIREACEEAGITTYAYYNKYKAIFDKEGIDAYSIDETISVEAKHLSIEEKTKIYDIIKQHPEYGAKRISEELNTEPYGFTQINESRIYDELVRSRLNTRQLREAYIARSGRKKRMKPPGTPMMTLDGKIILNRSFKEAELETPKPPVRPEKEPESRITESPTKKEKQKEIKLPKDPDDNFYLESLMIFPIEDLLKKQREEPQKEIEIPEPINEEKQDLEDSDLFEKEEFLLENIKIDESQENEVATVDQIFEDIQTEYSEDEIEEIGIEHEFSFRDIWEEQDVDIAEDGDEEKDIENGVHIIEDEDFENQDEAQSDLMSSIKSSLELDELLENTLEEQDEIGFEMLTEDMSFKDEIFIENDDENGKLVPDDENMKEPPNQSISKEVIPADLQSESEEPKKEDDILAEDDYSVSEFSFNDLLEEIERDISFFDSVDLVEEEVEVAYEDQMHAKNVQQMQNDDDSQNLKEKKSDVSNTFPLKKHDRLREKHLILGLRFYQEQKYKLAVEEFLKVIEIYPDFKEAYSILGNAYYRNNQISKAIKSYEQVKQLDPFDADAYENTGVIYANMGKYEDAIKEWRTLLEFRPEREDIIKHIESAEKLLAKT